MSLCTRLKQSKLGLPACLTAALLAGCAVGPDYQRITPGQAAPEQFRATVPAAGPHLVEPYVWWSGFQDGGLDTLVQRALLHSPDIASADASIAQARAGITQTASARDVQVNGAGRVGRDQFSRDSENFANIPFSNPATGFTDYRGGLDASWEIDLFGHIARNVESARAKAGAVELQRQDVALRVSAETARNVLDYRHLQLRLANASAILKDNREVLRLVQLQRRAGVVSDMDVKQAEIGVSNAQSMLPSLEAALQTSITAMIPLTGLPQEDIASELGHTEDQAVLPEAASFSVSSQVLERRPDVRIAERQLAAATADIGAAMADQYPRFTLVGGAGWDSIHPGQFGQQASRYWNFGPQLYLPILNGNHVQAAIKQAEAAHDAALANYRKAVLAALADVESAMLRCQGDHGRLTKLDAAVKLQNDQIMLTQQRVDVGEAPQFDVLNAQIQRSNLVEQQLATRQALAEDLVLLYKALGGRGDVAMD